MCNFAVMFRGRFAISVLLLCAVTVVLAVLCLFTGTVDIPWTDTMDVLAGGEASKRTWTNIILQLRIPATVVAALSGASLAVAGLLLQTTFNNPLAGPSIMGVSSGASLGAAVALLAGVGVGADPGINAIAGALAGALLVIAVLVGMSAVVRSATMLLIVGIMLGYLASSGISLLNFYATQEGVHSYVIWGMGNFQGVGRDALPVFGGITVGLMALCCVLIKPLDGLLLGDEGARCAGINVTLWRCVILFVSGALTAVVTAYCGPIGFIGLAVPHIARWITGASAHRVLIPAVILTGCATGLLTLWITMWPGQRGTLPINAITPAIGIPVVIYILLNRHRRNYFE